MKCANGIVVHLLLIAVIVVLECQSMAAVFNISDFMECTIGGNMSLYVNHNHIINYTMGVYMSYYGGKKPILQV